jgi:hypothetical protein
VVVEAAANVAIALAACGGAEDESTSLPDASYRPTNSPPTTSDSSPA